MPSDNEIIAGWNSTDDTSAEPVPVTTEAPSAVHTESTAPSSQHRVSIMTQSDVTQRGMTFSAVLGVVLALGGVVAYMSIGGMNIRGDLAGGIGLNPTVIISMDGQFTPPSVQISKGQTVIIKNENADPQVLKPKNGRMLFPVQVVFDQPYTFTVPSDASGEYVYYSETLPENRTLTFIVQQSQVALHATDTPIPFGNTNDTPIPFGSSANDIPIPFGTAQIDTPIPFSKSSSTSSSSSSTSSSSSSSSSVSSASSSAGGGGGGGGGGTIYVGTTRFNLPVPQPNPGSIGVPTNPYTVGTAPRVAGTITDALQNPDLRDGAPITENSIRLPKRTPDSGTGGFGILALVSLLGVLFVSRESVNA